MKPIARADIPAFFQQHGIRDVECMFPDVSGYPRGKLMPVHQFVSGNEMRIAQLIPMQAITGDYSQDPVFSDSDPDLRLVPDHDTLRLTPWSSVPRALVIHDCVELDGSDCAFAPRSVLRRVVQRYTDRGLTPVVAPEIEFYLTSPNSDPNQPLVAPLTRDGRTPVAQAAFGLSALNDLAAFWDAFRDALNTLGIDADTWMHESGPSQYEINLLHGDPIKVADQAFLFKYAAKEIALRHGLNAVFMAKPIGGAAGSSMHLHQSVVDSHGRNIFSAEDGGETPAFRHYIAGLQSYIPDLMLVFAPFVNSYRRYVRGSMAPVNLHWGYDNRSCGLRIPVSGAANRRVENRIAGADANPYLAMAASLAAGLAGMDEQLSATEPLPQRSSGYTKGYSLERSFLPAHEKMVESASARRLLGDGFVDAYTSVKALEYNSYLYEISAWERRYLLPQV